MEKLYYTASWGRISGTIVADVRSVFRDHRPTAKGCLRFNEASVGQVTGSVPQSMNLDLQTIRQSPNVLRDLGAE